MSSSGPSLFESQPQSHLPERERDRLSPDPGAVLPPHHGTTITDLQDLVERHDLAPFVRIALAEYLRANHLPSITYYELSLGQQAKIQRRARELELRRNTVSTSTKAAHTPGPWREFVPTIKGEAHEHYRCIDAGRGYHTIHTKADREKDGFGISAHIRPEDARLIATAPALDLILQMCELGVARLEICSHEFCFNGLRYSIGEDRDWNLILNVIGWDTARAAVQKALGQDAALPVSSGHEGAVE